MPWIPDVTPNTVITSEWGNDIRDHVVTAIPDVSQFGTITNPHDGQVVYVANPQTVYIREGSNWIKLIDKTSGAWRPINSAWGYINGSVATVGNPSSDIIMTLTGDGSGGPGFYQTVQGAGFGPFNITTTGDRMITVQGIIRFDGGALGSSGGTADWLLQRGGTIISSGIVGMDPYGPTLDTSRVSSMFAMDKPPSGQQTYQVFARFRSGTGSIRVMAPLALAASDSGPVTASGGLQMMNISGLT